MLARARWIGILDDEIADEAVLSSAACTGEFESNADRVLEAAPADLDANRDALPENVFGYLFAAAAESDPLCRHSDKPDRKGPAGSFSAADAWGLLVSQAVREHIPLV